ncbi:cobalt-precorrin-5B (C(1))-methyltransferase [Geomobilimonas luticola]|uniref:Cobalt-precorrin-5B C(1)-methyltransferase n=1 Tax=Geomobilimonas luticola TaxID=1114878 RepID=A0ABS5SA16_9BACT|nr:cobalt-precorrin-5B (C(1))-methyltransferase [Geomobilimonas luticola]MBT0652211.1 cobalt-precorrin-5B (C(1))-methyltransferase [Geomobilimonas luticola]
MGRKNLRHGYTTGACAAAAAKGAAQMLRDQALVDAVDLNLPTGETARFTLHGQQLTDTTASCYVVKDAGDDPDVTNGAEVHVTIRVEFFTPHRIVIEGGTGIGRVTKPGLAVPPGEWAINPVPRRMITEAIKEVLAMRCMPATLTTTVSIPNGAELAKKTLNERLGIVGGLSILGTTGIVRPISAKAWTDTIDTSLDVALACGCRTVVLSTGRTSELVAQKAGIGDPGSGTGEALEEEAFVMMGDHVGYALRACVRKGVKGVVIAGQFAKLLKIACGHEQTHVSSSELDLKMLAEWFADTSPRSFRPDVWVPIPGYCRNANTARHVLEASGNDRSLVEMVCDRVKRFAGEVAPGVGVKVLLAGYNAEVLYFG